MDSFDNVYVTDDTNESLQKFDSSGSYITQWVTNGMSIAISKAGYVYTIVYSEYQNQIVQFDLNGNEIKRWNYGFSKQRSFITYYMVVDNNQNIYISDPNYNRILSMNVSYTPLNISSSKPTHNTIGVATNIAPSITFDQGIISDTAYSAITFKAGNTSVAFSPSISDNTLTLTPMAGLQPETTYTITIPVNSVKSSSDSTLATIYTFSFTTEAATYGDVNGDGSINISDVIMAVEISVDPGPYPDEQIIRANVDNRTDMTVDISDVVLIAERSIGGTDLFPVEMP